MDITEVSNGARKVIEAAQKDFSPVTLLPAELWVEVAQSMKLNVMVSDSLLSVSESGNGRVKSFESPIIDGQITSLIRRRFITDGGHFLYVRAYLPPYVDFEETILFILVLNTISEIRELPPLRETFRLSEPLYLQSVASKDNGCIRSAYLVTKNEGIQFRKKDKLVSAPLPPDLDLEIR